MKARGADFSVYQSVAHVASVAPSIDFAFVKLTQGRTYLSPVAIAQTHALIDHGKKVGFYHFLDTGDGARQWDFFESMLHMHGYARAVVAADYEMAGVSDQIARAFIARGRQRGFRVGLYGDGAIARRQLGQAWTWAAWWSTAPPPFKWDIWQFSDGNGAQDWNVFNGDAALLGHWWDMQTAPKPATRPPLRWWAHDETTSTAIGPMRTATLGPRLAAYVLRHRRSYRFALERK